MVITSTESFLNSLKDELDRLYEDKATGEMVFLTQKGIVGKIYLLGGRILYLTTENHPIRHWKRATQKHCQHWEMPQEILKDEPWEWDFIYQGVSKRRITLEQARSVITDVTEQCLFELALLPRVEIKWTAQEREKSTFSYFLSLAPANIHPILANVHQWQDLWNQHKLSHLNPSLAPCIVEKGKMIIKNPVQLEYLSGDYSIWDFAVKLKQSVVEVAKSLQLWKEKGLIEFKTIPDLSWKIKDGRQPKIALPVNDVINNNSPLVTSSPSKSLPSADKSETQETLVRDTNKYLIACIDDSPIVIHNLKKILTPAGFQILSIEEPMAGFGKLIEHKPDLILLDLNMPNANGYSVCKFLRESPVFEKTPIIILTAQDRTIDRAKAKLVGASDFINKPPEAKALIDLIKRLLNPPVQKKATQVYT